MSESKRHYLSNVKIDRKNRVAAKGKLTKAEQKEGLGYKCGEF